MSPSSCSFITAEQRAAFEEDGYIVIRGLLDPQTAKELAAAGHEECKVPLQVDDKTKKQNKNNLTQKADRVALTNKLFQDVALRSVIPKIVAELMQLDPKTQTLRLIHDFFLSNNILKPVQCDWHVDGHGLWPESNQMPSITSQASGRDQDGINAWVALDDMPIEHLGSMAVAAGSHRVPWRYDAHRAIGRDINTNGGETWQQLVQRIASGSGMVTHPELGPRIRLCSLSITSPDLNAKLEERKRVFGLCAGDVIFCTRNLFHRTLEVTEEGRKHFLEKKGQSNLARYTIRYTPGSAIMPSSYCWQEWSMLMNPEIAEWNLDKVAADKKKPYWFPSVWPQGPDLDRLQALPPHVDAAKKELEKVQKKLFAEVAAAKEAASTESDKAAERD